MHVWFADVVTAHLRRSSEEEADDTGQVVSVRGSVVDVRFLQRLPAIYAVLRAVDESDLVLEVLAQLDAQTVRAIALTATRGLARGRLLRDTGQPLLAPVGSAVLSRMLDVLGRPIDRR